MCCVIRVVSKDRTKVVVDAWSGRQYKTLYSPKTSFFASTLGSGPVASEPKFHHGSSVLVISGVGPTTATLLADHLLIYKLGDLIDLADELLDVMQAIIQNKGITFTQGGSLRLFRAKAIALVDVGLPDVASESEEEEHISDSESVGEEQRL